jgi:hypothetical protein
MIFAVIRLFAGEADLAGLQRPGGVVGGVSPAAAACALMVSGLTPSCGAEGSQPMRSARTLKSIRWPLNWLASASGDSSSRAVSFS